MSALVRGTFEGSAARDPFGLDPALAARAAPLLEFLYQSYWRVDCRDVEQVPSQGPVMVVSNQGGSPVWDALVLRTALFRDHPARRDLRALLDENACQERFLGPTGLRLGALAANPENALAVLEAGKAVAVFPEGSVAGGKPWAERYRLRRFGRGGFVKIALRAGAPIVPCAIVGNEEATLPAARPGWLAERLGVPDFMSLVSRRLPLGPLGLLPLPTHWTLRFGNPVETAALGSTAAENPEVVSQLADRVRSEIQRMLDEDLSRRSSIFF